MIHSQIFKRTSAGKVQIWQAETTHLGQYRTISGQIDGVKTVAAWTQCVGKNPGKKNEVLPEAQALKEVSAMYTKQLRKDYHENVADIDQVKRVKPMLADRYADVVDAIDDDENFLFQPKYDGFRCLTTDGQLSGKEGLPINTVPHIVEALNRYLLGVPVDGELYNHAFHDNFDKIASMLRKEDQTHEQRKFVSENIKYYIYDIQDDTGTLDAEARAEKLHALFDRIPADAPFVRVPTYTGKFSEMPDYLEKFLAEKYEGAMGRKASGLYERKRTRNLIKLKKFLDAEYIICDIVAGKGKAANHAASVVMQNVDGSKFKDGTETFDAGILGSHEYCANLLINKQKYIGSLGEIKYPNLTPAGKPRFGKLKQVRFHD